MDIFVDNRLRIPVDKKSWPWLRDIRDRFIHNNPEFHKQRAMGVWVRAPRYIETAQWDDPGRKILSLPRGGLWELMQGLMVQGVEPVLYDNRVAGEPVEFELAEDWKLRPYQEKAVTQIMKWETCLVEGAAGSGKTEILLAAMARAGLRTLIIVPDGRIFDQWIGRAMKRLGMSKSEIGTIGNKKKFKLGDRLTIATQPAAWRRTEVLADEFGFVGMDEAAHGAAKTYFGLMDVFKSKFRVGISAHFERQDLKQFLTHDIFGPIAYRITREDLEGLGWLQPVDCLVVETDFRYDYMNKKALRKICEELDRDPEITAAERLKLGKRFGLERREFGEYCTAASEDPDRNSLIAQYVLAEVERGSRCLIFTNRREHCEIWAKGMETRGLEAVIFWGGGNAAEKRRIEADLARLQAGEVMMGIGTVVDEALDLPAVEAGFICQRVAQNPGKLEQQAGRLARMCQGKEGARLYYFWDKNIPEFEGDLAKLRKRFPELKVINGVSQADLGL